MYGGVGVGVGLRVLSPGLHQAGLAWQQAAAMQIERLPLKRILKKKKNIGNWAMSVTRVIEF